MARIPASMPMRRAGQALWAVLLLLVCMGTTLPRARGQQQQQEQRGPGLPRRMAGAGKGKAVGGFGSVGFDRQQTMGFVEYLSLETLDSIDTFDRLSVGLNMTIEDFFNFINRLLEDEVPDKRAEDDWEDDDTLTVEQLGQLFGGVNETAVAYILDAVGASVEDLQAGFNTVDVLMVLMYVSAHLEANGVQVSLLDIISGFCDKEWEMLDADVWVANVAKAKGVKPARLKKLMSQLEGSLENIRGYVEEIVRPDACELLLNPGQFPSISTKVASRFGNLRGKTMAAAAAARSPDSWEETSEQEDEAVAADEEEEEGLTATQRRAYAAVAGSL